MSSAPAPVPFLRSSGVTVEDNVNLMAAGATGTAELDAILKAKPSTIERDQSLGFYGMITCVALGILFTLTTSTLVGGCFFCATFLPFGLYRSANKTAAIWLDQVRIATTGLANIYKGITEYYQKKRHAREEALLPIIREHNSVACFKHDQESNKADIELAKRIQNITLNPYRDCFELLDVYSENRSSWNKLQTAVNRYIQPGYYSYGYEYRNTYLKKRQNDYGLGDTWVRHIEL